MRKTQPKILLINTCAEWLHYPEFVKPIEDILRNNNMKYFVRDYLDIDQKDIEKAEKIIICGTSLKDELYLEDTKFFNWILKSNKPLLGICAGMQIIGLMFKGQLKIKQNIGLNKIKFNKSFLGIKEGEEREVYELHNFCVDKLDEKEFEMISKTNDCINSIKHKKKEIYGVLFHPEVRNKDLIKNFVLK